jgi:hypothetical protein
MALLNTTYDVEDMPQGNSYEPLPAGWYDVSVTEATLQTTKAGNGQYIKLRLDVTGPTHQGRVVYTNLNISNPNPKAEEIGRQQLGDIMRAIGLSKVRDTDQLVGGALQVKLAVKQDEQYGASNEAKGFKAIGGAMPAAQSRPQQASSAPAASGKAAPPWAKK